MIAPSCRRVADGGEDAGEASSTEPLDWSSWRAVCPVVQLGHKRDGRTDLQVDRV